MTSINPYEQLLSTLLASTTSSVTISTPVSPQALRKGLRKALKDYALLQEMLGLESKWKDVTLSAKGGTITVELVGESLPSKGKGSFSFIILDDLKEGDFPDGTSQRT